jgi:hypothetical protein
MRTEASMLKPLVPCQVSMSVVVVSSRRPWRRRAPLAYASGPEYADLNGSLERFPMVRCQVGGFTEGDNSVLVLGEDCVEDDEVVVK